MVAALAPAIEATSIAPAEATRRASYEIQAGKNTGKFAAGGVVLLVVAALLSLLPAINGMSIFGYVSSLFTICGAALLMPQLLKLLLPILASLFQALFGAEGKIAARSLEGTLGRTSVATASLMIGIAMMVSLAIMIGSFRETVTVWVNQSLKADLWIQTAARAQGSRLARMSESTVDKIRSMPDVLAIDGFVEHPIDWRGEPTNIAGADLEVVSKYGNLIFADGQKAADAFNNFGEFDAIITEAFAIRKHVHTGEFIHINAGKGDVAFRVRGIYYDYASDLGYIVIPRKTYAQLFQDNTCSNCAVYLKPSANSEQCRLSILRALGRQALLKIRTTRELRAEVLRVFDRTFAITYALHTIAVLVALLSVMNALFALALESKREFGILRYIGASQSQLRRIVLVEAGILAAVGNITGMCLGFVLSLLLIYVVNRQSFGWTVQLSLPFAFLGESAVLVFVTAIVSGLIPAQLAARTLAPSVVRDE
jgi:putative ABC transport system permease protein